MPSVSPSDVLMPLADGGAHPLAAATISSAPAKLADENRLAFGLRSCRAVEHDLDRFQIF